jgi:thymidylate synthase
MLENTYKKLISKILLTDSRPTRNGITKSKFGAQIEFNILDGFPIITGRKMFFNGVIGEMAAFLKRPKNIHDFKNAGCNYWNLWGKDDGTINIDYGNKWFDFNGINQIDQTVKSLKNDPYGRRHLITAWDPVSIDSLDLPCCHYMYQFYVNNDGTLDLIWIQRSVDVMLGLPSDFILAALFNILMAKTTSLIPGRVIMQLGDCHIYQEHISNSKNYLSKKVHKLPSYNLNSLANIYNFSSKDIVINNYIHNEALDFKLKK